MAPNTNRSVLVTAKGNQITYVFARPINLVLPYAMTLTLSAFFVVIGLRSLHANGVPVATGSFLQVLGSTRGSQVLDTLAVDASRQGRTVESEEVLRNFKVRLGRLAVVDEKNEDIKGDIIGFGSAAELLRD